MGGGEAATGLAAEGLDARVAGGCVMGLMATTGGDCEIARTPADKASDIEELYGRQLGI